MDDLLGIAGQQGSEEKLVLLGETVLGIVEDMFQLRREGITCHSYLHILAGVECNLVLNQAYEVIRLGKSEIIAAVAYPPVKLGTNPVEVARYGVLLALADCLGPLAAEPRLKEV